MKLTRAIAMCALTLAIALAIGAISPMQPYASASTAPIYIFATAQPAELPTPALPTAPPEQPQVVYVELPTPQPQVVYVEQQQPAEQTQAAPQSDPATQYGTPEFNAALAAAYAELPVIECPCGIDAAAPAEPATARELQYSRQRTR